MGSTLKDPSNIGILEGREPDRSELESLLGAVPMLVAHVSPDLKYRFVNAAYEEWFGRSRSQIVGRSITELLGHEAYERLKSYIQAALDGETVTFDACVPFRFGGTRNIRATYVPRFSEPHRVSGFFVFVLDRTQEVRRETYTRMLSRAVRELSASLDYEQTLRTIVDLAVPQIADVCTLHLLDASTGVLRLAAVSNASRVAEAIRQIERSWPLDAEAILGPTAPGRGQQPELVSKLSEEVLAREAHCPEHLESLKALALGSRIRMPLHSQKRVLGLLSVARGEHTNPYEAQDVPLIEELSERAAVALENAELYSRAREAIRRREEFLSVASHELKTPITTLQLRVQSLAAALRNNGSGLARELSPGVGKVETQVRRLTTLVEQLLDASRIAAGRLQLMPSKMDLVRLVRDVVENLSEEAEHKGSSVTLNAPQELSGVWDRGQLERVVSNLLSNAIKFGRGQPIQIHLSQNGDFAVLGIHDSGIGIALEHQARIFERFERAVSPTHFGGMGLGLWIAMRIVRACHGTLEVASTPDAGSTFTLRLPITKQPAFL